MNKPYELEFYYKGDVIDLKSFDILPNVPDIGEEIYLQCENENMNDDGYYFKVIEKRSLFFSSPRLKQKIMMKLDRIESTDW